MGGLGVCKCVDDTAELDAEAPGTYPRDHLYPSYPALGSHEILLELWLLLSFEQETVLPAEQNFAILTIVSLETSDSHEDAHTRYIDSGLLVSVPDLS